MNRILLIEDDSSTQHLYRARLQELRHEVVVSSTGAMGVMEARTAPFDLFLVDVHLGDGIDGYEVCRRLKAIPGTHRVPVVLISGRVNNQEDLHRGYEAGCQAFVVKGDPSGLEDVVRAMLRIKSLQDDLAEQNRILEDQNRRLQAERARAADLELALGSTHAATHFAGTIPRPEGVLIVDDEGIVRVADRGARELCGHHIEGRHLSGIAPHTRLEAVVRDARTEPRESVRIEINARSGGRRSLLVSVFPLVSALDRGESRQRVVLLAEGATRRASAALVRRGVQGLVQAEWGAMLEALRDAYQPASFLGVSRFARDLRARLGRLASTTDAVFFQGPPGSGKELAARILHHASQRSSSFLVLGCGGREETVAVDLFGDDQAEVAGFLALAQGGTLVLEDIERLPVALQERLVRTVTGTSTLPGHGAPERLDVRLVVTTRVAMGPEEARWKLHPDLYRLVEAEHVVFPPLAGRFEDTAFLAEHFLVRHARHEGARFAPDALALLLGHSWPENVDDLAQAVRRACESASGPVIEPGDLPAVVAQGQKRRVSRDEIAAALPGRGLPRGAGELDFEVDSSEEGASLLDYHEKLALLEALRRTGGDKLAAARMLGVGKSTFYRKVKQHRII